MTRHSRTLFLSPRIFSLASSSVLTLTLAAFLNLQACKTTEDTSGLSFSAEGIEEAI